MGKRIKLGDIHAIPLPDGRYAFCRVFKDGCIAVYAHISHSVDDLPGEEEYQFVVGVYADVLKSGLWKVVGNRPFQDSEEQWPPPMCIVDSISGEYSIYHMGEIRKSNRDDCDGLEIAAVWEAEHIVARIMGDTTWHG
ncbi:MAG TPA: Imm26 family immunity protein [Spirochaetota bacterium]|nr:Imm26 family immunity protein [Spirochaetota bacterium]